MPNCFTLTPVKTPEAGPALLSVIDAEMCKAMEVECHPVNFLLNWVDSIGYMLALGKNFAQIKEELRLFNIECKLDNKVTEEDQKEMELTMRMAEWLEANYVPRSWAERGGNRR